MERYEKASQYVTQKMERKYPSLKGCRITITPQVTRLGSPFLEAKLNNVDAEIDVKTRFSLLNYANEARLKYNL